MFEGYDERAAKVNVIQQVVRTEFPDAVGFVVVRDVFDINTLTNAVDIEMATQISMRQLGDVLIALGNQLMGGEPPDASGIIDENGHVTMNEKPNDDNGN